MEKKDRARGQAKAQIASIVELVAAMKRADLELDREEAIQAILGDPLSVEVRSGWHTPGWHTEPCEFQILLCTGGPACRIIGELGENNEPYNAIVEYQDWFTKWEPYTDTTPEEAEAILEYCRCFYFGA